MVLLHQILGEYLGAFNDSRVGSRAKSGKARRVQGIYHTGHQRIVRGHYHQVCLNLLCQRHDAVYIHRSHIVAHCIIGNAPIARAAMHTVHSGGLFDLAHQCVLAATAAYHQNRHIL